MPTHAYGVLVRTVAFRTVLDLQDSAVAAPQFLSLFGGHACGRLHLLGFHFQLHQLAGHRFRRPENLSARKRP